MVNGDETEPVGEASQAWPHHLAAATAIARAAPERGTEVPHDHGAASSGPTWTSYLPTP